MRNAPSIRPIFDKRRDFVSSGNKTNTLIQSLRCQPLRVSRAIREFMMMENYISIVLENGTLDIIMAPCRMFLHDFPFFFRQRISFIENPVLDKKLTDIMKHSSQVGLSRSNTEVFVGANHYILCYLCSKDGVLVEI